MITLSGMGFHNGEAGEWRSIQTPFFAEGLKSWLKVVVGFEFEELAIFGVRSS